MDPLWTTKQMSLLYFYDHHTSTKWNARVKFKMPGVNLLANKFKASLKNNLVGGYPTV